MTLRVRDSGWTCASAVQAGVAGASSQAEWQAHLIGQDVREGEVYSQTFKLVGVEDGWNVLAFLYCTGRPLCTDENFLSWPANSGSYHSELRKFPVSGNKPGLVQKRDAKGVKVVKSGEPVMVQGEVSISDDELSERFQTVHDRLTELLPCLEAALGESVDSSLKPKPRIYSSASPEPYNGPLPNLVQGRLFRSDGATVKPCFDYKHDSLRLT
ncbi:hypothetical protein HN592_00135 [Candidatus Woesearchaeota archaeon]|nr:hypothetical protein [Candidatus Woesearchaeota archaeon]MBT4368695.1 hypothetical protein [Candidatus Woesearchaeota archaeon]MBT4711984.1 hypothetical protein [Candidatus Woesearchaeota archaeon]MBT6638879.1 hypothetical protein [Candidatus Woesearchaeota archaeon]MBT7134523.1 hypothetical protein [Candidatus Woesearchaeota archaeon]